MEKGWLKNYNKKAYFWERTEPKLLGDFLCRPYVFKLLGNVKNKIIADIGCGEGYVSRYLASKGAKVIGVDISKSMIAIAKKIEKIEKLGIDYFVGSALNLKMIKSKSVDYVVSVLVFNVLSSSQVDKAIQETYRILKKGGHFILAVLHPWIYICKPKSNWIKFNYNKLNYREGVSASITIYAKDKMKFDSVDKLHTIEKYFNSLIENGFIIEKVVEPKQKKYMRKCKDMWGEENRLPFYLIIKAKKS
jgi:ubiquinone/menaquinone biosynthesis C-methylase UbiE